MISIFVFIITGVVIPVAILAGTQKESALGAAPLCAILPMWYGAMRIGLAVRERGAPLLASIFGVFVYMNFGVAALVQGYGNIFPWPGSYTDGRIYMANFIVTMGCAAFEGGLLLAGAWRRGSWSPQPRLISPDRLKGVILGGVPALVILFAVTGWHHALFVTRAEISQVTSTGASTPIQVLGVATLRSLPLVVFCGVAVYWLACGRMSVQCPKLPFPYLIGAGACFYGLATLIFANPISTPRYWQGTVVVALGIIATRVLHWNERRWVPTFLVLGYLVVFPLADTFRRSISTSEVSLFFESNLRNSLVENLRSADFDSYQGVLNSLDVVEAGSVQWGRQLTGSVLFFVPRSLWPEKPVHSGMLLAGLSGYNYLNLACPLWAEGYLDFGLAGVCLFLGVYGLIIGMLHRAAETVGVSGSVYDLLIVLFAGYQIFFLRGALMNALAYFAPAIVIAIVLQRRLFPRYDASLKGPSPRLVRRGLSLKVANR